MKHARDDKYKESFATEWQARRAARPDQRVYRRESDGRFCLTHNAKYKAKYYRPQYKRRAGLIIENEVWK